MNLSDNLPKNCKRWAMAEKNIQNEQIAIALNHLDLAKDELETCANTLYSSLQSLEQNITDEALHETLTNALASLQMQDIITQRIEKLKDFLTILDANVSLPLDESYLNEFAWENEVNQDDIDAMFNEYKG